MATEAIKSGQYQSGVVFHELLVKQSLKEEKKKENRHLYFGTLNLTHKHSKELLIEAMKDHDRVLLKRGHLGRYFQCNAMPFNKRLRQNESILMPKTSVTVLDRDKLFSLTPEECNRRRLLGRKRWAENGTSNPNDALDYITSQRSQAGKLCNGVQLRVIYAHKMDSIA